jgi:hypothetical protein
MRIHLIISASKGIKKFKTKPNKSPPKIDKMEPKSPVQSNFKNVVERSRDKKFVWITMGLLGISEVLPFLPVESNGLIDTVIHGICKVVVERVNADK